MIAAGGSAQSATAQADSILPVSVAAADAHFAAAGLQRLCGNLAGAAASYQAAIDLSTSHLAEACYGLGGTLLQMGRDREALAALVRSTQLRPDCAEAYLNLGMVAARLGSPAAAIIATERAIVLNPSNAEAHYELGRCHYSQGELERAASAYRRAIHLGGEKAAAARHHLGIALTMMGDPEGLALHKQMVAERPRFAAAHFQWSVGLLLHGQYGDGWREYEWRILVKPMCVSHPRLAQPRWQGEPLEGKPILLYTEQGFGDTLQFMRYVPMVAARGRVILEVEPHLERLLRGLPGVAECVVRGEARPHFSCYAPLMSLAHVFATTQETIPAPVMPRIPEARRPRPERRSGLQVGLVWGGSPRHERDSTRSISLDQWKPLSEVEGVAFTSLQKGPAVLQIKEHGACFGFAEDREHGWDFADTAALVADLDLVITVDTAVAHLAGTMGKPVWILLSHVLDWRWGLHATRSAWYPSARLFRQTSPGDWSGVMEAVASELRRSAGCHRA